MIKAVLLDLDDTLLHINTDQFIKRYMSGVTSALLQDYPTLATRPIPFQKAMAAAAQAIAEDTNPIRTNAEVFGQTLADLLGVPVGELAQSFDHYHAGAYGEMRKIAAPVDCADALVNKLGTLGLTVVIATTPIFTLDVIRQRLNWAGLDSPRIPFTIITTIDEMHFSKPLPHYYEEILARVGVEADETIMVGDSLSNDMLPAAQAGLNTFWIDQGKPLPADMSADKRPDGQGTLADFYRLVSDGWLTTLRPRPHTAEQIIPRLTANVAALLGLAQSTAPGYWSMRPVPQEWSPLEIVCHLRDSERAEQRARLQRILTEDNPFISQPSSDRYRASSGEEGLRAIHEFWQERRETIAFFENLRPEDWNRPARHSIFGPTTLLEMAHFTARHDHLHISQFCETVGRCSNVNT